MSTNSVPAPRAGALPVRYIVVTAMLSAVALVLTMPLFKFPLPIMPGFIKLDVSDLPSLLGAFALGPACGVLVALLKNVLNIVIEGTTTGFVGELCNFALNAAFAGCAGLIYKHRRNITGAILGSLAGAVFMGLISVPVNYFVMYPVYASLFGGMDLIIQAYQKILPAVDSLMKCLLIFNLPFTVAKGLLCAGLCFLIYKPLSPLLRGRR